MKQMPTTSPTGLPSRRFVLSNRSRAHVCSLSFPTSLLHRSWESGYTHSFNLHGHIFLSRDGTMLLFILAKSTTHFQN